MSLREKDRSGLNPIMNTPLTVAKEPIAVGRGNTCSAVTKSTFLGGTSPNFARKKRRGVIEKKRRDRINHSLAELRHLIPRTMKKQSSSKLEKAEILQMTVDHLKLLHTMRGIAYFDANVLAVDFRTQGFQECVGEVGRYLSSLEGIEEPHSLGARLLSHLSNCAAKIDPLMSIQTWPKMAFPQPLSLPSSPSYSSSSSIFRREITLPWNSWPQLLATSPAIRVAPIGCLLTNQSLSLVCTPSN